MQDFQGNFLFCVYLADKDLQVSIIGDLDAAKAIKSSGKVVGKWFLKKISIQGSHLILEWCHSDTSLKKILIIQNIFFLSEEDSDSDQEEQEHSKKSVRKLLHYC